MRFPRLLPLALLAALPAQAQFWSELANPKVEIALVHPPDLGLRAGRIAFAPGRDADSREFTERVMAELVRGGKVEIVPRERIETLLREPGLQGRSPFDPGALEALGRGLGPAVLVVLEVPRATVNRSSGSRESKDSKGVVTVTRTAKATLDFLATLQAADLGSGRVLATQRLEESASAENSSSTGTPSFPGDAGLRREAFDKAVARIQRMLLPWSEVLKVTFFDDDAYRMDQAAKAADKRDFRRTLELAIQGEAEARADQGGKAKYRERALYNLGVAHMLVGYFVKALPFLTSAREQNDASIFRDGLQDCEKALKLQEAYRAYDRAQPAALRQPAPGRRSLEERLEELQRLHQKGLITSKEYDERKAQLLKEL